MSKASRFDGTERVGPTNSSKGDAEWWSANTFTAHIKESLSETWPVTVRFQCGLVECRTMQPGRTPA